MKTKQELIDEVMDHFNFAKVQRVMKMLNWKWDRVVPTEAMLRKGARNCLNVAADTGRYSGGGFHALKRDGQLRLYFALEDYRTVGRTEDK